MDTTLELPTRLDSVPAADVDRRRAFWAVMACFLVHGLVVSTWVSRIASIKSALGLGDGSLGLALLGSAIGSVSAIPICGSLVVRYGSRHMAQWTATPGFCVSLVAIAWARDGRGLFAALLLYGAMAGANDVAMNAQAVATEKLLGTPTMSRFHAMFSIGGIAGAGLGAVIAGRGVTATWHLMPAAAAILIFAVVMSRSAGGDAEWQRVQKRGACQAEATAGGADRAECDRVLHFSFGGRDRGLDGGVPEAGSRAVRSGLAPVGYAVFSAAMAIFRLTGDAITLRLGRARVIRYGARRSQAAGTGASPCSRTRRIGRW